MDGATFDLIKPWADEGKLPTFSRLLKDGAHGILMSTPHANSAQAWSTFITGMNAGKRGISDDAPPADIPPNRFFVPVAGVLVGEWTLLELPVSEDARRLFPKGDDQSLVETRISAVRPAFP